MARADSGRDGVPDTLVSIFGGTVADHPDVPALDNGAELLTYSEFAGSARALAAELARLGIGRGDRVGVRVASGSVNLYVAIMAVLIAGAAYVPVDADDPDERARLVFEEAGVAAVIGNDLAPRGRPRPAREPFPVVSPSDDAWIIFTSGSTGIPKGVAVSHASASAFVEAEAELYLRADPICTSDRVMAGLSVAFDASCEEMWLAWRHGACLVPAPRSVVRSGVDLGPWMVANRVTVVSTVPTLLLLWPAASLDRVRLLILGGEACPPEVGARFDRPGREVWNTYGPTEATVVACAALVRAGEPVRIGLPLQGWDLAVVDANGQRVAEGERGELIIGGVGLARYLDPSKDAEKFAPMPTLGWERAYRSGDIVVNDPAGLIFVGRGDDQVKVGGRRIELGELDAALLDLPGVRAAAAAVRTTASGTRVLVGYLATSDGFDRGAALTTLRRDLPAALVPRLALVDEIPTRTSGKVDREALPWPLPAESVAAATPGTLTSAESWLAEQWQAVLGAEVPAASVDFFDLGGSSLTTAHLVARLRERYPESTVADVYDHPTLAGLAAHLDAMDAPSAARNDKVGRVGRRGQLIQLATLVPLRTIGGLRWVTLLATGSTAAAASGLMDAPTAPWPALALGWLLLVLPPGRMLLAAGAIRLLLAGLTPGRYPRAGAVHLRLWAAERVAEELMAASTGGAMLMKWFGRLLGARIGADVDLHTVPPVTGLLTVGDRASIEFEVDLAGYWVDGDELTVGLIDIGPDARVGARSTLGPGSVVGTSAQVTAGSSVQGTVPAGECWAGSPAAPAGAARGPWQPERPPRRPAWGAAYAAASLVIGGVPVLGVATGLAVVGLTLPRAASLGTAFTHALAWAPIAALAGGAAMVLVVLGGVRLLGLAVRPGAHPVQSAAGWAAWTTFRLLDEARTWLFPLYSGWFTPTWLRLLGADVGSDAEASTVVLIPKLSKIGDGSFLADDTMLGGYELGGGWLRVEHVQIGKHAFLGNSGMAAPGRKVPSGGLVAVLSAAPRRELAKKRTSWLGSPPEPLRRTPGPQDATLTYAPSGRLRVLRGVVEAFRVVPVVLSAALGVLVGGVLLALASVSWWLALAASGVVLVAAGIVAGIIASLAKATLVGRVEANEHALWTSFVWRSELADAFVECLAVGWLVRWSIGTPLLNAWLRTLGARIGRGVWCETYWLPEPDLVELRDGATVNPGCVIQTHLFHDRVLSLGRVLLGQGATLGPNSVVLPGATIGRHATIGPASLVMRGESVPKYTRWIGNPIGPWPIAPGEPADDASADQGYGVPS